MAPAKLTFYCEEERRTSQVRLAMATDSVDSSLKTLCINRRLEPEIDRSVILPEIRQYHPGTQTLL